MSLLMLAAACSSDQFDDSVDIAAKAANNVSLSNEIVVTDQGEVISLSDTAVYEVTIGNFSKTCPTDSSWDALPTRAASNNYPVKMSVKGYDKKEQYGGYKKMIFTDADKVGLHKGTIYLVCFYKIYKDLAQNKGESIGPRDYTSNLDDTAMGWDPEKLANTNMLEKGFSCPTTSINGWVKACTVLRFIKCDVSGISYNKFIPYQPENLVWQYVLRQSVEWDQ